MDLKAMVEDPMTAGAGIEPKIQTDIGPNRKLNNGACSPLPVNLSSRNNNTTPFHNLPKDVLCELIHMTIGEDGNTLERLIPLTAVSSGLRNFIHGTLRFWNVIGSLKPKLISRALERSGDLPLKIYIEAKGYSLHLIDVRKALVSQSHRIAIFSFRNITSYSISTLTNGLTTPNLHTFHAFQGDHYTMYRCCPPPTLRNPRIEGFILWQDMVPLCNLRTLHLIHISFSRTLGLATVVKILRGSPNLEVLSLESIRGLGEARVEHDIIELPNLRFLSLSEINGLNAFQTLCSVLRTPSLQTTGSGH
ncbi:hypothetical protein FRB95_013452 [Tulasnella sp. JGI-2019a]|nr:hypothetical protein FRB95_013452 [Tulasnella sp. JGI-2019a]